jgi:putative transposase
MRTHPWEVSDALWARVEPHIPPALLSLRGGRSRVDDRTCFGAILYVLRTGMQWNALPKGAGCSSSTAHRRFQEWEAGGFFEELWKAGLTEYDELKGIEWEWQAVDGTMTKAPFGGAATGANPTDRGKSGTKRSLLTDGGGIPVSIVVAGANRHDKRLLEVTLDSAMVPRPKPSEDARQHLCLDRGYDYDDSRKEAANRGYEVHIPLPRGQERSQPYAEGSKPRRWVVERTHSWLNRSRRLLVRWEKKVENYLAFLHLACAQLIFGKLDRLSERRAAQPT